MSNDKHIGSTLDDFLKPEGLFEDASSYAMKRVLARQVEQAMKHRSTEALKNF